MAARDPIRIEGLADLARELRQAGQDLPKRLRQANKEAVGPIVPLARRLYDRRYTSGSGKSRRSIRALASQRRAQVAIGRRSLPHLMGQEFGSNKYPQFPRHRTAKGQAGYFLSPAIREKEGEIRDRYLDVIDDLARGAFPRGGR